MRLASGRLDDGLTGNGFLPLCTWTVLRQVGMFVFLTSLSSAHTLSTGSVPSSSYSSMSICQSTSCLGTYGNGDQQARALDLAHVGNGAAIVGLKGAHNLPASADDAHVAVIAAEEEAIGAGADARDVVALEEAARVVVGEAHGADVEEIEGLPLRGVRLEA